MSVQKSTRLFSTEGTVEMTMKKIDRAPKAFFAVEIFKIGDFSCTPFSPEACNDEQWNDNKTLPPLELSFDYGDGSPIKVWTMNNPTFVWGHEYAYVGEFEIKVHGRCYQGVFTN